MEKKCEIVQDLIPLVADQVASGASIEMVEEHIKDCEECHSVYARVNKPMELLDNEKNLEDKNIIQKVAKKQRRRLFICAVAGVLCTLIIVFLYCMANRGYTSNASVTIGPSQEYSREQLEDAVDAVKKHFREEFPSCKLLTLTYEEEWSKQFCAGLQFDTTNAVDFVGSYYVYPWCSYTPLTPDKTVDNWNFTVQYQSDLGRWIVISEGY